MITVFLTNAFEYERGNLHGTWITLPIIDEELKKALEQYNLTDGNYIITDYERVLPIEIDAHASIHDLNKLAQKLEDCDNIREISALLDTTLITIEDLFEVDDLDKLTYDYSFLYLNPDISDEDEALGRALHEYGYIDLPEHLETYFDFEAYGRDVAINEGIYVSKLVNIAVIE